MRFVLPLVILLAIALTACAKEADLADLEVDAGELVARAISEMNGLDSYSARFIVRTHPDDVRGELVWETAFQAPDSYRLFAEGQEGPSVEVCERVGTTGSCRDVMTSITGTTFSDIRLVGDTSYARSCEQEGKDCEDWRSAPRPELLVLGPSPSYFPQWPFVVLELLDDPQHIGNERIDGSAVAHLRGSANQIRAILRNQDRMLTDAGIAFLFDECDLAADLDMTEMVEACREQITEQSLLMQDRGVSFQDENPPTVDVWISIEDGRLHQITITGPLENGGDTAPMTVEYSRFNEVIIEAPEIEEGAE